MSAPTNLTAPAGGPNARTIFLAGLSLTLILTAVCLLAGPMGADVLAQGEAAAEVFGSGAGHAVWLLLWVPAAALAASGLLFLPWLSLALAMDRGRDGFAPWLARGFAFAVVGNAVVGAALTWLAGSTGGRGFLVALAALSLMAMAVLARRAAAIDWGLFSGRGPAMIAALATPLLVYWLMLPKFTWESMNGDGAHFLLSAELMVERGLPLWPPEFGELGGYPSLSTMLEVFPASFFVRLFGAFEFSARIALFPGLALLAALIVDLAEPDRSRRLGWLPAVAIIAALALYAWVLGWNASYDPYFADVALPLGRDPYAALALLGFVIFLATWRPGWLAVFALLNTITLPSSAMLMGLALLGYTLASRPREWRRFAIGLGIVVLAMIAGKLAAAALVSAGLWGPSDEFGLRQLAARLRYVSLGDYERLLYWVLPCGILPAFALILPQWQDRLGRALAVVCLAYAAFFYLQAYRVLPHHFGPEMVLPLIVFWRLAPVAARPTLWAPLALAGVAMAFWASLPPRLDIHRYGREFARRILVEPQPGDRLDPVQIRAFHDLMMQAFPVDYSEDGPRKGYVGSPLAWYVHAVEPKPAGQTVTYRVHPATQPAAPGWQRLAQAEGLALDAQSLAIHEADRTRAGLPSTIAPLFYVRRDVIFGNGPRNGSRTVYDLAQVLGLR